MKSFKLTKRPLRTTDRVLGCGCLLLIGFLLSGAMIGAMMGDYIGPPEGAAADSRSKGITMLLSFAGLVVCFIAASRLLKKPKN